MGFIVTLIIVAIISVAMFFISRGFDINRDISRKFETTDEKNSYTAKRGMKIASVLFIVLTLLVTLTASFVSTDRRQTAVYYMLNKPHITTTQGYAFINPMADHRYTYNTGKRSFDLTDFEVTTGTNVVAALNLEIIFRLNGGVDMLSLYDKVGDTDGTIQAAITSAVRSAASEFGDDVINAERDKFGRRIVEIASRKLSAVYVDFGVDPLVAETLVTFSEPNIGAVKFPEKVANANNELAATAREVEAQANLDLVAKSIAGRRLDESTGIANLFVNLPEGAKPKSADDVSNLLQAISQLNQSKALMKMATEGGVKATYITGNTPVAVK